MKLFVSFVITEYEKMKLHWKRHSVLLSTGKVGTNKPIGRDAELGGCLVDLDWDSKKERNRAYLSCPSGFDNTPEGLAVASMRENKLYFLDNSLRIKRCISNRYFNDLHSVSASSDGILLTSTGIDGIIELDSNGKILWSWYAFKNGYTQDQFGEVRCLDLNRDHRNYDYPTLYQTTHVNSAVEDVEDKYSIYASLFHQGQIIKIERQTGAHPVVWDGLKNCHSIRYVNGSFIVSNTRGLEIVLFDNKFNHCKSIPIDSNWIADAILSRRGTYLVADAHNFRIVEMDGSGKILSQYQYDRNWKIYQIMEVA